MPSARIAIRREGSWTSPDGIIVRIWRNKAMGSWNATLAPPAAWGWNPLRTRGLTDGQRLRLVSQAVQELDAMLAERARETRAEPREACHA